VGTLVSLLCNLILFSCSILFRDIERSSKSTFTECGFQLRNLCRCKCGWGFQCKLKFNMEFYSGYSYHFEEMGFYCKLTHFWDSCVFMVYREPAFAQKWPYLHRMYIVCQSCVALPALRQPVQNWKAMKKIDWFQITGNVQSLTTIQIQTWSHP